METDERAESDIGNVQTSEENFKEVRTLSPVEEESESTYFKEASTNFSEQEESSCKMIKPPYKQYHRILRKEGNKGYKSDPVGDSSSGDERMEQDYYQLRRVKGSYCCFRPEDFIKEAEASGDNDEAETGLREKSLKTTVEQLKYKLSQVEREIVALKRYQNPQKCQSHERCEILQRDLLTWRDDHEKRITSQIVKWQLAERRRIYSEMENMRKVYDNIERHLETLERQNTKSHCDLRRQIDAWEKRLKEDIMSLHESDLMELREQLRAWFEIQSTISSSNARKKKCEVYDRGNDTAAGKQDESYKSTDSEMITLYENNDKFLHRIEHIVKSETQQHRDDLVQRIDQKIAELWSAFENFKHNFHLDRDYRRHNYAEINNDETESILTEDLSDLTCQETVKSCLSTDFEDTCTP